MSDTIKITLTPPLPLGCLRLDFGMNLAILADPAGDPTMSAHNPNIIMAQSARHALALLQINDVLTRAYVGRNIIIPSQIITSVKMVNSSGMPRTTKIPPEHGRGIVPDTVDYENNAHWEALCYILLTKHSQPYFYEALMATGDAVLVYVDGCNVLGTGYVDEAVPGSNAKPGLNWAGQALMAVRSHFQQVLNNEVGHVTQ